MSWAERVLGGEVLAAARVIRWLEDGDARGIEALQGLHGRAGRAHVVGITGPPGAGKSTLVDAMVAELRSRERTVGVIAVDPSSPFTGGAILGDRVRMQRHALDPGVFIRSMATRGSLGGLARASFEACLVLDAMGRDVVIVETVGVGQDELDVVDLAHTTVVVSVPGLGDGVQALKAGILEIGQIHVLNKADRAGADDTERQLVEMLHRRAPAEDGWQAVLQRTVAASGEGVPELVDRLEAHRHHLEQSGALARIASQRRERWFDELLRDAAAVRLLDLAARDDELCGLLQAVRDRRVDPHTAVHRLLERFAPAGAR